MNGGVRLGITALMVWRDRRDFKENKKIPVYNETAKLKSGTGVESIHAATGQIFPLLSSAMMVSNINESPDSIRKSLVSNLMWSVVCTKTKRWVVFLKPGLHALGVALHQEKDRSMRKQSTSDQWDARK